MKSQYFHQTIKRYFLPLTTHPIRMVIVAVTVSVALYISVDILLAEVIRQSSPRIHILSAEQLIDFGPDFSEESKPHAEMIRLYTKHLEGKQLGFILRWLYPQHSMSRQFAPVLADLDVASTEEEAKNAIRKAGQVSLQLYKRYKNFPKSPKEWFNSEELPEWLLTDINTSLVESARMAKKLENDRTYDVAIETCRRNRHSILLLSLGQLGYNDKEEIQRFLHNVRRVRDYTRVIAEKTEDENTQRFLYNMIKSEERRIRVLEAMLTGNTDEVCKILKKAIEIAFEKEKATLR